MPFGQMPVLDNGADAIMINIAGSLDADEPVRSGLLTMISYAPDDENISDPVLDLKNFTEGKATATRSYARYWHGYIAFLRPMLSIITLSDVRKISFFLQMFLFSLTIVLLSQKISIGVAIGFAVSMALADFPVLAFCLEYSDVFVIALSAMSVVLYRSSWNEESLVKLFLLCGSLTVFIGFGGLTAPMTVLCFPLLTLILMDMKQELFRCDWAYIKKFIRLGSMWAAGYILTWSAKWILAGMTPDAIQQIAYRTGNTESFALFDRLLAIAKNIYILLPFSAVPSESAARAALHQILAGVSGAENISLWEKFILLIENVYAAFPFSVIAGVALAASAVLVYAIWLTPMIAFRERRRHFGVTFYFFIACLFLIPYVWLFLTANHSSIHCVFTFRNQISSVWLFLILPYIMRPMPKNREI
ncbi:hypothetical protein AGMMS49957_04420 [Synergistales bacterium]|nr:hypothetical protein AGMMS49957_04420 [Synergistales bacterium]